MMSNGAKRGMTVSTTFTDKIISPDVVRDLREKLGMTQAQLADEAKVSEAEVIAYEAGAPSRFSVVHEIGLALLRRGAVFPKPR
jgi:DNA-binding XRE family transcriptional regulator